MQTNSSIKWRLTWKVWFPVILFFIPLILETQLSETYFTPYVYGLFALLVGIIYYFRFGLWQSIMVMGMTAIAIWIYFLAFRSYESVMTFRLAGFDPGPQFLTWIDDYLTPGVFLGVVMINFIVFYSLGPTLVKALDMEKSAIQLFKLAAREVSGEHNGFTGRPFQAGEHNHPKNTIIGFASYLEEKKICKAGFPGNGIKLYFSMGISPLSRAAADKLSYVFFGDDGKLNVFISASDYKQYRKEYTFDQLCELMGKTFLRFIGYYTEHLEKRIITELKSA